MKKTFFLLLAVHLVWAQEESKSLAELLYHVAKSDGVSAAISEYHRMKSIGDDGYSFGEAELNNLGYRLMGDASYDAAIEIFAFNVRNFPDSPNTYDSLAEALMKAGRREEAISNYNLVLEKLGVAGLDSTTHTFLENNARSKLAYLNDPEKSRPSTVISDFLGDSPEPFGRPHKSAPAETEQFGQLTGVWRCTNFALFQGRWVSGWTALWAWKYILDGCAVQDLYFQEEIDLPPPMAAHGRDFSGTNVRIYDPYNNKWQIAWFHNTTAPGLSSSSMSRFEARFVEDRIIMRPVPKPEGQQRRVIFSDITQDSFQWRSEVSDDEGETWQAVSRIEAKRVR